MQSNIDQDVKIVVFLMKNFDVILGNFFGLCAMASDLYSSTRKNNKSMLKVQIVSIIFFMR